MKDTTTMVCFWRESLVSFVNNRWLVFVAAMWLQSCAGIGYLFGSISPVIKSSLSYNQRQVARLGVAKDLGDSVGFLAGSLCEVLPLWAALLVGAIQNLVGYGWVWLVVTGRVPALPLWAVSTTSIWIFLIFSLLGFCLFELCHMSIQCFVCLLIVFGYFDVFGIMWLCGFQLSIKRWPFFLVSYFLFIIDLADDFSFRWFKFLCLIFIHHKFSWWFILKLHVLQFVCFFEREKNSFLIQKREEF